MLGTQLRLARITIQLAFINEKLIISDASDAEHITTGGSKHPYPYTFWTGYVAGVVISNAATSSPEILLWATPHPPQEFEMRITHPPAWSSLSIQHPF